MQPPRAYDDDRVGTKRSLWPVGKVEEQPDETLLVDDRGGEPD